MNNLPAGVADHPSIQRLKRVARSLGGMTEDVVFIGGSIAPLLQAEPPFDEARPTKDVDGVVATTSYADIGPLHQALQIHGFRRTPGDGTHMHRWTSPDGDFLDLVPAGAHPGGSGQAWDRIALENSERMDLGDTVVIRHASAAAFLGLKWAAYHDRGVADPYSSHDLEDILALVASRPRIVSEIREAKAELKAFIVAQTASLLDDHRREDILAGHLNNAQDPRGTAQLVLERLERIRAQARSL
jgi:hypothetical protein